MSAKNLDNHNRWRNKTVAFRVSPEEDEQLEIAVRLSGLTKQDPQSEKGKSSFRQSFHFRHQHGRINLRMLSDLDSAVIFARESGFAAAYGWVWKEL